MQLRNRILQNQRRVVGPNDDTDIESSSDEEEDNIKFYRSRKRVFDRRGVYVPSVNDTWAIDLIDFSKSEPAFFVLNAVDIFSRKAESVKLNGKDAPTLKKGLQQIITKFGSKPKKIWSDKEGGFYTLKPWLSENNIQLYSLNNSYLGPNTHANPISERFNREVKNICLNLKQNPNPAIFAN